ncbi:MAG: hypothetical protein U1F26_12230 [Lysobacterales bacterium]
MECSTTTYLPRLALLAGLTCGLPATAQSPLLMNAFEVDRAGTTLVGGARTTLIDRNGNVIACIAEQSPREAVARLDGPGFLVRGNNDVAQMNGRGEYEWRVGTGFFGAALPLREGGAMTWNVRMGSNVVEFRRLDVAGIDVWRVEPLRTADPAQLEMLVDDRGRTIYSLPVGRTQQGCRSEVGMLDASGQLTWSQQELQASCTAGALADDGRGDFWWYLRPTFFRISPWGLPLASYQASALTPAAQIWYRPASAGGDALWTRADTADGSVDLVRLLPEGKSARFRTGHNVVTQVVADGDRAWIAANTQKFGGNEEYTIDQYSAAGRRWSRTIPGPLLARLRVQPGADLRLLSRERNGISVRRISADNGHVMWKLSAADLQRGCDALTDQ